MEGRVFWVEGGEGDVGGRKEEEEEDGGREEGGTFSRTKHVSCIIRQLSILLQYIFSILHHAILYLPMPWTGAHLATSPLSAAHLPACPTTPPPHAHAFLPAMPGTKHSGWEGGWSNSWFIP